MVRYTCIVCYVWDGCRYIAQAYSVTPPCAHTPTHSHSLSDHMLAQ